MPYLANSISNMPMGSLTALVQALLGQLPDDPSAVVFSVKPEIDPPVPPHSPKPVQPLYDPAVVYLLELCTVLTLRDKETVAALGADVAEALQNVLRHATSYHFIMISRTLFYLLNLLHASYVSFHVATGRAFLTIQVYDFLRVPVVLHTISSLKKDLFDRCAPLVLQGLMTCIKEPGPLRNEIMSSPDFWVILRSLTGDAQSAPTVFEILEGIAVGSPPTIMADNYESAVKLLNEFASAGSIGASIEQKQDRRTKRGQPPPPKKDRPSYVY